MHCNTRKRIIAYYEAGWTIKDIAWVLDRDRRDVRDVVCRTRLWKERKLARVRAVNADTSRS